MQQIYRFFGLRGWPAVLLVMAMALTPALSWAQATVLTAPTGSGAFGSTVTVLLNGNYVVTDPLYSANGLSNVGAAYLYDSRTNTLLSTLTGAQANDQVGSGGVVALPNGNYVVRSPNWTNGASPKAGAATWGSGTSGISGPVSAANSLVGTQANDQVGSFITVLPNSNYLAYSLLWANGSAASAGAVTWGSGTSGVKGPVSAANSLIGSRANDRVGGFNITVLPNGNYVVNSPDWASKAGAATWGSGTSGISGPVSAANSLVGAQANDQVSSKGTMALTNSNYVVSSPNWANGTTTNAGAATWGSGTSGVSGTISTTNSLVGAQVNDQVGSLGVVALTNGNYVVRSDYWANGTASFAGAATWGNGTSGTSGAVSAANSLVGTQANDRVGVSTIALANGNYAVGSAGWANGAATRAGAVTWGNGTSGTSGAVSTANSLVGSQTSDLVGIYIEPLANGSYVVGSYQWANGAAKKAGAATWASGTGATSATVSAANSLVGTRTSDAVGQVITALPNSNYVVSSNDWANGAASYAGAATWGSGTGGVKGTISATNSLIGTQAYDRVGLQGVEPLTNGNYVVRSPNWANGTSTNTGAATWGSGTAGVKGTISATNSLIGSQAGDGVGTFITALANGNYVVRSVSWSNGAVADVGAVTWGSGTSGVKGTISAANSLIGSQDGDRVGFYFDTFTDSNYLAINIFWANGSVANAISFTPGSGNTPLGPVTACNSVVGSVTNRNYNYTYAYRASTGTVLVGLPLENSVQLGVGPAAAPTGAATQNFVAGATVANLVATGQRVQWYTTATGGGPLAATTPLVSGSTYYASQRVASCESTSRLAVTVTQVLAMAPAALAEQVALYPNPVAGSAFVALPASLGRQAVAATLLDAVGRPVRTLTLPAQGPTAHVLDLHLLPAGMYMLCLSTSAGTLVKKLTLE